MSLIGSFYQNICAQTKKRLDYTACDTLIQRAMAKNAGERYASAHEFAEAVTRVADKGMLSSEHVPASKDTEEDLLPSEADESGSQGVSYPRWLWFVALALILVGLIGAGGYVAGLFVQPTATATPTLTATIVPVVPAATTRAPSPTFTAVPSPTTTPTATGTSTPITPTPTSTSRSTATATGTTTATPVLASTPLPLPRLVAPLGGQHQSPITFQWTAVSGVSYQVTLRHLERNIAHTSNQIRASEWTFDIPADQFGNWEWFVTVVGGQSSSPATFTFNPFPDSDGNGTNDSPPANTPGAATPEPVPPTTPPEPTEIYP